MAYCHVSTQEAIHADEPEQYSASDILGLLRKGEAVVLNDVTYELYEITDLIDAGSIAEAVGCYIQGDTDAIDMIYINKISEMQL